MEKGNDLRILQKTEDMILYANKALEQFPRSERYALAADIKRTMYSFYRLIIYRTQMWNWRYCGD